LRSRAIRNRLTAEGSRAVRSVSENCLDPRYAAIVLDRRPKLLVDRPHRRAGRRFAVPDARQTEEIARKLGAARVQDEGPSHSEDSAEKASLEHDVVPWGGLTGFGRRRRRRVRARPVVPSEHEGRKVDFVGKLEEALQSGCPGIERRRPGLDVRDVFETARERLEQLRLLSR